MPNRITDLVVKELTLIAAVVALNLATAVAIKVIKAITAKPDEDQDKETG